jgi:hypothetical protein
MILLVFPYNCHDEQPWRQLQRMNLTAIFKSFITFRIYFENRFLDYLIVFSRVLVHCLTELLDAYVMIITITITTTFLERLH